MTTGIRAIICDFGGVLINWEPQQVFLKYFSNDTQAVNRFLEEIGFVAWNLEQDRGRPFKDAVIELSARFPQYATLIRAYDKKWEESITGVIPKTVEILKELKDAGYLLYGLSNWSAEKFLLVRRKFPAFDLFDDILVSGEVKLAKPDPAIFELLLARIRRKPHECLLIDDSPNNISAAQKLDIAAYHFTSPEKLAAFLHGAGIL